MWPPDYKIRRSKRARHIRLRVDQRMGLEIVLPMRAKEVDGIAFMHHQRDWIEKHLKKLVKDLVNQPQKSNNLEIILPDSISLPAINRSWKVEYHRTVQSKTIKFYPSHEKLAFVGSEVSPKNFSKVINQWLLETAKQHLAPQIELLAKTYQFNFKQLGFRHQKTLWGSCTNKHSINLNCKLLFLPPEVVRYVLIHELCHTVHFDHSEKFWQLVSRFEPDYINLRKLLRQSNHLIPAWYRE